jgi:transcriptional regulator with XRE-family HTH domain
MNIGKEVKERREKLKLSKNDLCKLSGISRPTLDKVERCENNVNIDTLIKLFNIFDRRLKFISVRK